MSSSTFLAACGQFCNDVWIAILAATTLEKIVATIIGGAIGIILTTFVFAPLAMKVYSFYRILKLKSNEGKLTHGDMLTLQFVNRQPDLFSFNRQTIENLVGSPYLAKLVQDVVEDAIDNDAHLVSIENEQLRSNVMSHIMSNANTFFQPHVARMSTTVRRHANTEESYLALVYDNTSNPILRVVRIPASVLDEIDSLKESKDPETIWRLQVLEEVKNALKTQNSAAMVEKYTFYPEQP